MSEKALVAAYDVLACDLDGVVYRGGRAVLHAVETLAGLGDRVSVRYVTNNASRSPADVSAQLQQLGLPAGPESVLTSAQAGARLLASRFPAGTEVLAVGGPGVAAALREFGLVPVDGGRPRAVLQGWGPHVTVEELCRAAIAISRGAMWIATNLDLTLPTADGLVPGNGSLVAAVATATGQRPESVGKPQPAMYAELVQAVPGRRPHRVLAIGDRLDTDIAGAHAAGLDSLLVLTGVHGLREVVDTAVWPRFAAADLRALLRPIPRVTRTGLSWATESLTVSVVRGESTDVVVDTGVDRGSAVNRNTLAAIGLRLLADLSESGQASPGELAAIAAALDRGARHPTDAAHEQ